MTKDTGGPAFPFSYEEGGKLLSCNGMTLRDWFAGQALAGHLASMNPGSLDKPFCDHLAMQAYWVADAMLQQRGKDDA